MINIPKNEEEFYRLKTWMQQQKGDYAEILETPGIPPLSGNAWIKEWRRLLFEGKLNFINTSFDIDVKNEFIVFELQGLWRTKDLKETNYKWTEKSNEFSAIIILKTKMPKLRARGW